MDIGKLIGETTEYDKKQLLEEKDPRSWLKSVSAFANGMGGALIFGIVDKTDEIVGLSDPEGDSEKISRFLRDRMDPIPSFMEELTSEGLRTVDDAVYVDESGVRIKLKAREFLAVG